MAGLAGVTYPVGQLTRMVTVGMAYPLQQSESIEALGGEGWLSGSHQFVDSESACGPHACQMLFPYLARRMNNITTVSCVRKELEFAFLVTLPSESYFDFWGTDRDRDGGPLEFCCACVE